MPSPREVLSNDLVQGGSVYHVWEATFPGYEGEWILMRQDADQATKIGTKREVYAKANDLLDSLGGAFMVVRWVQTRAGGYTVQRVRSVHVANAMTAGRVGISESKLRA